LDIERTMRQMRETGRSDRSIRNYVGVIRALFNLAMDKRRRWCSRNRAADVDLPKSPDYSEIRSSPPARCGRSSTTRVPAMTTSWTG
jgi:hypothetical protein